MTPELSIVVVNFNSGAFLAGCLASLAPALQGELAAEILVVDNASTQDQSAFLAAAEARGARVLRLAHNTGYAGGCNRGLAATSGSTVFLLNADVVACAGALPTLARYLAQEPQVALAEPRCYVDAGRAWLQPEFWPLRPREILPATLSRLCAACARRRGRSELRRQLVAWRTRTASEREALSGAFLAARRATLERLGGFDEGYPLAYEDSDLFRRARKAGLRLALVPEAEAIHFAHRSRITVLDESLAKDRTGRRRYLRTHHGRAAVWLDRAAEAIESLARRALPPRAPADVRDLGAAREPLELELTGPPGPFVLQLALEPSFALAAGHFGTGERYRFTAETWSSLLPTTLHVRAFALESLAPRGAWTFRRSLG